MVWLPNELWVAIFRINARLDAELNHFLGRLRVEKGRLGMRHAEGRKRYYKAVNGQHEWDIVMLVRIEEEYTLSGWHTREISLGCTSRWYVWIDRRPSLWAMYEYP